MNSTNLAFIQIVGTLIACSEGVRDDWRNIAQWVSDKLNTMYGSQVRVKYYDLFDENIPDLPKDAKLPIVILNGVILTMEEKISFPKIRTELENIGIKRK